MESRKTENSAACKVRSRVATYSRAPRRLLPPRVCHKLLVNSQPAPRPERFGFTSAPTRVRPDRRRQREGDLPMRTQSFHGEVNRREARSSGFAGGGNDPIHSESIYDCS